jgi:hypothetical protein
MRSVATRLSVLLTVAAAVSASLSLTACNGTKLNKTSGQLDVVENQLTLPSTFVGYPTQAALHLKNSAPTSRSGTIQISGPFTSDDSVTVDGAATVPLTVTFKASTPGDASGTLTLTSEGHSETVSLSAHAEPIPICPTPATCHQDVFVYDAGGCVDSLLPENTDCGDPQACLETARCVSGVCEGVPRSCDDNNVCTADACAPGVGCVHTDLSHQCPPPPGNDPCQAALCDPIKGCTVGPAPDGTPCGPVDCITSFVCLLGTCQGLPAPEGLQCAPGSPCQGKGFCHNQKCVQPDPTILQSVWTYQPADGGTLLFPGLADSDDNLYWLECHDDCDLVSATRDAFSRFRVEMKGIHAGKVSERAMLLTEGLVIVGSGSNLEALQQFDGSRAWTSDLNSLLPEAQGLANVYELQAMGDGTVNVLAVASGGGVCAQRAWVLQLGLIGPKRHWAQEVSALSDGGSGGLDLVGDEQGQLWVMGPHCAPTETLTSFDASGRVLSLEEIQPASYMAALGSTIYVGGLEPSDHLLYVDGGGVALGTISLPTTDSHAWGQAVADSNANLGLTLGIAAPGCSLCTSGEDDGGCPTASLTSFDSSSGAQNWTAAWFNSASWVGFTQPVLTDQSTLLIAQGPLASSNLACVTPSVEPPIPYLWEITTDGSPYYRCQLPQPAEDDAAVTIGGAMLQTRWVRAIRSSNGETHIEAYDLQSSPLGEGWITGRGGFDRAGRPH